MKFGKTKQSETPHTGINELLKDFPRGVQGRVKTHNWLPHQYFEDPKVIEQNHKFRKGTGDIFLGVVNGKTSEVKRQDGRTEHLVDKGTLIGSIDDRHLLCVAGSRSGKGRSVIIPNLLTYGGSIFTIDPKSENAAITAQHRAEKLGQDICIIDPFGITPDHLKKYVKRFNPMEMLQYASPTVIEDAGLIAGSLITHDTKDRHWSDSAQMLLEGIILHVSTDRRFSEEDRNLVTVADLAFGKIIPFDKLIEEMIANDAHENRVAAAAFAYLEKGDSEKLGVLSNMRRHIKFLDYNSIQNTFNGHDFDFEDLKKKPLTVYVCLPVMRMNTCSGLLRLAVNLVMAAMEREKTKNEYPTLMILDEFPTLGYMQELENAIGYMAGFHVKLWIFVQDLSQLKALYKERWETFIGNCGVFQAFGNSEQATTQFISKQLGQTTMTVATQGAVSHEQRNSQGATGQSFQQQLQNLLSPEEVSQYFSRNDPLCRQLILQPGTRPWVLQRACYDYHEAFKDATLFSARHKNG